MRNLRRNKPKKSLSKSLQQQLIYSLVHRDNEQVWNNVNVWSTQNAANKKPNQSESPSKLLLKDDGWRWWCSWFSLSSYVQITSSRSLVIRPAVGWISVSHHNLLGPSWWSWLIRKQSSMPHMMIRLWDDNKIHHNPSNYDRQNFTAAIAAVRLLLGRWPSLRHRLLGSPPGWRLRISNAQKRKGKRRDSAANLMEWIMLWYGLVWSCMHILGYGHV